MNEATAIALALVFGLATTLLVRSREVTWWSALLIFLCGFYTGQTGAFFMISETVNWVLSRVTA
ncbi:hypothetical protein [Streptomyces sp. NRRL F-5135]|uniref:hypothetical protein n=1 Tax=Streptomyces sp. NRRL F-5135 TaxID=1463858 RepID=UPI0004CAEA60|nr:hypothetical protein [Streptomyces sp. NRRL F-5135]